MTRRTWLQRALASAAFVAGAQFATLVEPGERRKIPPVISVEWINFSHWHDHSMISGSPASRGTPHGPTLPITLPR